MKISWTEHRSDQEVLDMADENRSLVNTIRQRQKNRLGHVLRNNPFWYSLRRQNGRDKNLWETSATMIDWMKSNDVEYEHIKKKSS